MLDAIKESLNAVAFLVFDLVILRRADPVRTRRNGCLLARFCKGLADDVAIVSFVGAHSLYLLYLDKLRDDLLSNGRVAGLALCEHDPKCVALVDSSSVDFSAQAPA